VAFNEKMATSVKPTVTFGTGYPFDQNKVEVGEWNDAATGWTGTAVMKPENTGLNYVVVSGGEDRAGVPTEMITGPTPKFYVIAIPPEVEIVSGPAKTQPASTPTPVFTVSASVPIDIISIASVEYQIDEAVTWATVAVSPVSPSIEVTFATPALSDGPHNVRVRAKDTLGQVSEIVSQGFAVDTKVPKAVSGEIIAADKIKVLFSEPVIEIKAASFEVDGTYGEKVVSGVSTDTITIELKEFLPPVIQQTGATLTIATGAVVDLALNPLSPATAFFISGDTTKPEVDVILSTTAISSGTIDIALQFSEALNLSVPLEVTFGVTSPYTQYAISGDWVDYNTWQGSFSVTSDNEGTNTIRVAGATDLAGNVMKPDTSTTFKVDTTAPEVVVTVTPDPALSGTVTFMLAFNEKMDDTVDPTVTFGKTSPYDTYSVSGDWVDDTHWAGTFDLTPAVEAGIYHVSVSGAIDEVGNQMATDTTATFTVTIGKVEKQIGPAGGTVELGDGTKIVIPADALEEEVLISIEMISPDDLPAFVDTAYLTATGVGRAFGPSGLNFLKPVTIIVPYSDGDVPEGVNEEDLALYFWDGASWQRVGNEEVDTVNNLITAKVNHFTIFRIVGDTTPVGAFKVYLSRNPFRTGSGTYFMFNLPKEGKVTLKIYDATGDLVRTLIDNESYSAGPASMAWNGDNDFGNFVGSGIYIYRFEVKYTAGGSDKQIKPVGVIK